MAKYNNSITFQGGINTDDDPSVLPNGDYIDAFYSRSLGGVQGSSGQLQSVTGNALIPSELLPVGTNTVIGTCAYTEINALVYFVHNSGNNHSVYMVDNETEVITIIAQSNVFNFKLSNPVFHAFVANNILYWTDGYFGSFNLSNWNGPRRLDINWAINGGTITREAIAWDIYQPWRSPLAEYDTNNQVPANYLVGKLFQFRYQWIYRTGEESVWSPISKMPISTNGYFVEGIRSLTTIVDNVINVTIYTGSENVTDLRIAYREGNAGEFRVFKELNKVNAEIGDDTTYELEFTKDEFIYSLPLDIKNNELFPRVAECVELLPTNEAAFANVRQGYDKEVPGVKVFVDVEEITEVNGALSSYAETNKFVTDGIGVARYTVVNLASNIAENYPIFLTPPVSFPYCVGDVMIFQFYDSLTENSITTTYNFEVTTNYTQTTVPLRYQALADDLVAFFTSNGLTATSPDAYTVIVSDLYERRAAFPQLLDGPNAPSYFYCLHATDAIKTFKTGALHQFAIQYYDSAQKDGTVWRGLTSAVRTPTVAELNTTDNVLPLFNNPRAPFRIKMRYAIFDDYRPPIWATHYQIMYKPPKIDFQQRTIKGFAFLSNGRIRLSLEDYYINNYKGATIQMQPQSGDSVRFIRKANNQLLQDPDTGDFVNYFAQYADNNAELIIYETGVGSDGSLYIDVDSIGLDGIFRPNGTPVNGNVINGMIEIYRVNEATESDPWYEIGQTWGIQFPHTNGRYHTGDMDQVFGTTPAEINLDGGDIYLRKRPQGYYANPVENTNFPQMCWVEDPAFSDYFVSNFSDYGRIGIEDIYAKEKQLKALVGHTQQYLDNTRVNRLNQVSFVNITYLREEQGPINRLIMNGYTLTALQDRKNTSIYIQRTMSVDGSGTSNIVLSDKTFGGTRPLEEDWGTMHAGSVVKADGFVYYYDYLNATFVASTGGGQVDIAKAAKFSKGAYELSQILSGDSFMCAAVSKNFDELHFYAETNSEEFPFASYVYNFKSKRWSFKMAHQMDFQGATGRYHYTFKNGNIYKENEGQELTFFDNQEAQSVKFVFNVDPTTVKFYLNLWLQSNVYWDVPYIFAPASLNAPNGMLSHLVASQFKAQEGYVVAGYRRDESDPAFAYPQLAYANGRRLCGYYLVHEIVYEGTTKSYLLNAAVNSSVSRPVNK